MQIRDWPALVILALCAGVAIACSLFIFTAGAQQAFAAVVAFVSLGVGQLVVASLLWSRSTRANAITADLENRTAEVEARTEKLSRRVAVAESRSDDSARRAGLVEESFSRGMADLRASYADLARHLAMSAANPAPSPHQTPGYGYDQATAAAPHPAPAPEPAGQDSFCMYLEPVVDIQSGRTGHYRARLSMASAGGAEVPYEQLMQNAGRAGLRPGLDLHALNEVAGLVPQLRHRTPGLSIFVPLGAETLMDEGTLRQIISILGTGEPGGLVIELPHAALAGLPEQGLAGLALLARAGAPLAITEAAISGLDLDALASLGVRFLGLAAASVDSGYGLSTAIVDFARRARSLSMQIIVTGVATSELALNLPRISRFGAGPFFAPPRRLKPAAGRQAGMAFDVAA